MIESSKFENRRATNWLHFSTLLCLFAAFVATGCQATVGGQTLPSAYYLRDDIQFFPAGPEYLLTNQERALEEYRLQHQALQEAP